MKKVFILLLCILTISSLHAQNKQEKIVSLLHLMQSEQMIDKAFDNMLQLMKQQASKELNQDQANELQTYSMSEIKIISKKC